LEAAVRNQRKSRNQLRRHEKAKEKVQQSDHSTRP